MAVIRGVLLDLDGVLFVGGAPLPGAVEALDRLRAAIPVSCLTNTTRKSRRALHSRLLDLGFDLPERSIFTPARAACEWLRGERLQPHLLIHPGLREDFAGYDGDGTDAVVVGDAGDRFTYAALNRAFRLLSAGAPLLALAANRYFRDADGLSLDAGPFVAALEYASGAKARLFGKPAAEFFRSAAAPLRCLPHEIVMIGDDVEADVNGAIAAGFAGMLVRTGKYRPGDEEKLDRNGMVVADVRAAAEVVCAAASGAQGQPRRGVR
jgi:HAD superfamily hydrolase (TIGR01458 family)